MPTSQYKKPRSRVTVSASLDAPTKGLNSRDPPSRRAPQFADNLTNFIATPNGVAVREGFKKHATGLSGIVETLMPYSSSAFPSRLFAAAGGNIYEVTISGAAVSTGATSLSGLGSNRWSHVNFTGAAAHFMIICNGVDAVRHWNGNGWVTWTTVTTPAAPGDIAGIDPTKLESVISHQKRLWFVQKDSTKAWYFPVNSIGGGAVSFDFGPLFPRGGKLVALTSWSMNGGTGMQNYLVAISSNGDTVIYEGTDPSQASLWKINGTWLLGSPVGNKCFQRYGGDTLIMSQDGLLPLSKFMQSTNTAPALTDTIRKTISDLFSSQRGLPGFQLQDCLSKNLMILNVPQINPNNNIQLVYHTITGGWTLFTGWAAQCWATLDDRVYFGGIGVVNEAFVGFRDNMEVDNSGGNVYIATGQQSQNDFEKPGSKKRFVRAKVNIQSAAGTPVIQLGCNVDYDTSSARNTATIDGNSINVWGDGKWGEATWIATTLSNYNEWQTLGPIGYTGAIVIAISVTAETLWVSTDFEIELGGSR